MRKDCGYTFMNLHRLPRRCTCGGAICVAQALMNGAKMQLLCHDVAEGEVREDSEVAGTNQFCYPWPASVESLQLFQRGTGVLEKRRQKQMLRLQNRG